MKSVSRDAEQQEEQLFKDSLMLNILYNFAQKHRAKTLYTNTAQYFAILLIPLLHGFVICIMKLIARASETKGSSCGCRLPNGGQMVTDGGRLDGRMDDGVVWFLVGLWGGCLRAGEFWFGRFKDVFLHVRL